MVTSRIHWRIVGLIFLFLMVISCTSKEHTPTQSADKAGWQPVLTAAKQFSEPIRHLAYLAGSEQVAAASDQHLWVLSASGEKIFYESDFEQEILQINDAPRESALAVARRGWGLSLLDAETGAMKFDLPIPLVDLLAFDSTGQWVASADTGNIVSLRDDSTGDLVETLADQTGEPINALSFSADAAKLVVAYRDGSVMVWELPGGTICGRPRVEGLINDISLSADGRFLAISHGHNVSIYLFEEEQMLAQKLDHGAAVMALAFSPDSQWLATGGADHAVRLWNTTDWSSVFHLVHPGQNQCSESCGKPEYISSLAFATERELLFSGDNQGMVFRWQFAP